MLYINLEIDPASAINRFLEIYQKKQIPIKNADSIVVWNLRGHAAPLDVLVPKLIRRVRNQHFDAVVIDLIFKVITGDENNASDMGSFCNQFDKICTEVGCSTIYCHHHSKGVQGAKKAMDRASGSGVFARDPDAQLDIIQLELTEEVKNKVQDGNTTAWRMESNLREFPNIKPVDFWFEYPIHRLDTSGDLSGCGAEGSWQANLSKSSKRTSPEDRRRSLESAYDVCLEDGMASIAEMAEYIGLSEKTIRRYLKEYEEDYICKGGVAIRRAK